jgi:hypothetical protein
MGVADLVANPNVALKSSFLLFVFKHEPDHQPPI